MTTKGRITNPKANLQDSHESDELRRGPWTLEEDNLLIEYVRSHGEGRWNSSAKFAGLKRTGKSCRLRWLNYLKPDIKRGNLTLQEQLLILELHSKWGNSWSKIAQHLPGRTDNEIKNYWRTRVQKQARQLKVDSNSTKFLEAIRMFWMPRLMEKMQQDMTSSLASSSSLSSSSPSCSISTIETQRIAAEAPFSPVSKEHINSNNNCYSNIENINLDTYSSLNCLEDNSSYDVGLPNYQMMMQELELEETREDISLSGCHVLETDWFGEDLGSSTTFWNTDELWQN